MNLLKGETDSRGKGRESNIEGGKGVKKQKKWQRCLRGMMVLVKHVSASYEETLAHFTFNLFSLYSHTVKGGQTYQSE